MDNKRDQIVMLLDLCAFAYSQDPGKNTLRDLVAACRLAERHSLPEAEMYRDIMRQLELEVGDEAERGLEAGPQRLQDSVSP